MTARIIPVGEFDLVIFGATGDLSRRKLLPGLYRRERDGQSPDGPRALADDVAARLRAALGARERALLVAPGGTTPAPFQRALAGYALDWPRVDVVTSDERWVPEDHPRANARLLGETLSIGPAPEAGLAAVEARLPAALGGPPKEPVRRG